MKSRICLLFVGAILLILSLAFSQEAYKAENLYQEALMQMEGRGNYSKALEIFGQIIKNFPGNRQACARSQFQIGVCNEKMGNAEARKAYERVVSDYADQAEIVAQARVRLAALGGPDGAGGLVTRRVLTDASGVGGILTADGKYISHMDRGTGDVIQFEVASGQTSRVKNRGPWSETEKSFEYLAFSHDGRQVAYNSYTKDGISQVRIRNLDGSGLRTLYSEKGVANALPVDWSPDAGSILTLCSRDKSASELTLISTADGSVRVLRRITSPHLWIQRASFSPDGRFVAFSFVGEGSPPHGDVHLMTADGRNEVVVAGHPAEDKLLRWTPDGRSLVFLSDRSGTWDIWTVHITGGKQEGEPELLKKDFAWDSMVLGFAPDGSLYYRTQSSSGRLYNGVVDLETGKVLVPPAPVTTRTGRPSMPTWSPDGSNLAYISRRGSVTNGIANDFLTIRSSATGEERFLSPRLRYIDQISWVPDGRSIVALGIEETETGIFRIDTETSEITRLADQGLFPKLCPDGKTLVFVGGLVIRKRNLDTGEKSEVVKAGKMFYDLSPDGREVVFQVDGAVKTVSLNGGEPRELFRGLAQNYRLAWTRDGRYIIAQALDAANTEILLVPAKGGTPLKLNLSVPKMESFALHPDNSRFALTVNEGSKSELWVMENLLPKEKSEKGLTVRKIGSGPTVDILGAPSPDGKYLSMTDWETGDLALFDVTSGVTRRLTKKGSWAQSSEFALFSKISPDGKTIAYSWYNKENFYDMRTISIDGGNAKVVFRNEEEEYIQPMQWSPNGREILAMSSLKDGSHQIVFVPVRDGKARVLKTLGSRYPLNVSLSPDGQYIVYDLPVDEKSSNRDVFLLATDGSSERPLIKHSMMDFSPIWTPDGNSIIFYSDRSGSTGLWIVRVKEGKIQGSPELIKPDVGRVLPMGFTNDGTLYYGLPIGMNDIYVAKFNAATGQVADPPKPLSQRFVGANVAPDWAGDGKHLAYISQRDPLGLGRCTLVFHAMETSEEREIPFTIKYPKSLHWSPDGLSLLAVGQDQKNRFGVYRIDAENGKTVPIVMSEAGRSISEPAWLPDGKRIVIAVEDGSTKTMRIVIREISTGREQELHQSKIPTRLGPMVLSRDGRQLAFSTNDPITQSFIIKAVSTTEGTVRELVRTESPAMIVPLAWANDNRTLLYGKWTYQSPTDVWMVSTDGGDSRKTQLSADGLRNLRIHPDGERIAFTAGQYKFEVWVMENLLPKKTREEK